MSSISRLCFVLTVSMVWSVIPAYSQVMPEGAILGNMMPDVSPVGQGIGRVAIKLGGALAGSGGGAAQARAAMGRELTRDEIYYFTALDCQARKDSKGFFKYINFAITAAPKNWIYRSVLGDEFRRTGKRQKAIDSYLAAAKAAETGDVSGAAVTRKWAADQMLRLGKYADAERTYEKSLAQFSAYAPDIERRSSDPRTRQAWMAAKSDAMRQLVTIKTRLAPGRKAIASKAKPILDTETMPAGDIDVIKQADPAVVQMEPGTSGGDHLLLARNYSANGNHTQSLIEALAAAELDPKSALVWRSMGYVYLRQSRISDAAAAYTKSGSLGDTEANGIALKIRDIAAGMSKSRVAEVSVGTSKRTGVSRSAAR